MDKRATTAEDSAALLRDSEERYRKLIDVSPDAIFIHADWRIVQVNQAMLRLFRVERAEQLLGREVLGLIAPESREIVRSRIARLYDDRVHAPHCATPQPYLVPVRPTCSRITQRSGVFGSTSTLWDLPLMDSRTMVFPPGFRMMLRSEPSSRLMYSARTGAATATSALLRCS
jgi:hypothetical protein